MVDVELMLRQYGQRVDELCPEVTPADVNNQIETGAVPMSITTPDTDGSADSETPLDLLVEDEPRFSRRKTYGFIAAAAAAIVILVLAIVLRDSDDDLDVISENSTSTTEVSTTTELPTTTEVSTTVAVDPGPPRQQSAPLQAPNPSDFGNLNDVPDSLVTLGATEDEATFTIVTSGLLPGHPVTAWVVAADVEACLLAFPQREECQKSLVMQQPEVGNIGYLGGGVVAEDGSLTIEGTITSAGIPHQWYETPLPSFLETQFAVLLNDHGEPIEELLEEMTASYRAGCNDGSVLGAPDIALADGTPGPNSCAERQTVTFDPVPE